MAISEGTNLFTPISSITSVALTDANGLAMLASTTTTPATTANTFQKGCLMIRTDNGTVYQNTGTSASPTWSINNVGVTGPTGATGPGTGATGPTGPTGP